MILTVCTGNICRSPIAQYALMRELEDQTVESAGLHALIGNDVDIDAREAAIKLGLPLPIHKARILTDELVSSSELILVMENHHRREIGIRWPSALGKTFLIGFFEGSKQIPDPYRMGAAAHIHSASLIIDSSKIWASKLKDKT